MDPGDDSPNNPQDLEQGNPGTDNSNDTNTGYDNSDASKAEQGPTTNGTTDGSNAAQPSKYSRGWRRIVRNFTPSWFAIIMGTGIVSILLHNLPYNGQWLQYISYIVFALNVFLFILFFIISLLRYTLYPKIWIQMISHPAQSLFLGCFPMGLATIINMIVFVCVPAWGGDWWRLAWALWWIDSVVAAATCLYLPFVIMAVHDHKIETITAGWLLPIVSTIVAAATGSIVAGVLPYPSWQLITIITSYILWGMGESLAMVVLVCYFLRLTTHALPPKEVIVSSFLPLGPLGQGGFGIQNLGNVARTLLRETDTLPKSMLYAGDILYVLGVFIALVMWGFGLVWFFLAMATILRTPKFPFNMGWWGFTFPLGVYATCTTQLAKEIPSAFFRVLGTIFSLCVVLLWIVVSCGTLWRAYTGEIFFAPCMKDYESSDMRPRLQMLRKMGATSENANGNANGKDEKGS